MHACDGVRTAKHRITPEGSTASTDRGNTDTLHESSFLKQWNKWQGNQQLKRGLEQ
jgi:hypothetical protein